MISKWLINMVANLLINTAEGVSVHGNLSTENDCLRSVGRSVWRKIKEVIAAISICFPLFHRGAEGWWMPREKAPPLLIRATIGVEKILPLLRWMKSRSEKIFCLLRISKMPLLKSKYPLRISGMPLLKSKYLLCFLEIRLSKYEYLLRASEMPQLKSKYLLRATESRLFQSKLFTFRFTS